MDEMERRLRAAMLAAAEQPPRGLAEAIRRRHRRHLRRVGAGFAAAGIAVVVAIPPVTHELRSAGQQPSGPVASRTVTPARPPTAAPGTVLLTCSAANWGQLSSNWRATSLRAGPLWLVDGRQFDYAHYGSSGMTGHSYHRHGSLRGAVMIVEVADGSVVTMKPSAAAESYFRFVDGFHSGGGNRMPAGDTGFTFVSCPRGTAGPNGRVTDFYLGFSIEAGRAAPVNIWTPASSRPIRVTFTCPGRGCGG